MFRKHFRFKRLVLGFAFAAVLVPVAPAGAVSLSTFVDGGPAPVSNVTASSSEIRSEHARSVATLTALQADGLRLTAMAQRYQQLQPREAFSERSYGVPGPDPSLVPQVITASTSSSFDWTDAGIGASTVFVAALLLGIGIALTRRNQHAGLTSA
jgi:hypothetical protein